MDNKLVVAAIVAGILIIGGVGFVAYKQSAPPAPVASPDVPTSQLSNELPADVKSGSTDGQVHSTE